MPQHHLQRGVIYLPERKTSCEMMMGVCVRDNDDELCRVSRLHSPLVSGDDGPDLELRRDISRASGILTTHSCRVQKRAKKSHVKSRRVSQSVFCLRACAIFYTLQTWPHRRRSRSERPRTVLVFFVPGLQNQIKPPNPTHVSIDRQGVALTLCA
jgi:hypothetical protein